MSTGQQQRTSTRTAERWLDPLRSHRLPPLRTGLIDRLRGTALWTFSQLYDLRILGEHHLPAGPVILTPNHVGSLDGPVLVAANPGSLALAKQELFHGLEGELLTRLGQIPVDRRGADPRAIRTCLQVLADGRPLVVFPEGARGAGDLREFRPGAVYLAMVTGMPLVPVALLGTRSANPTARLYPPRGRSVRIVYGKAVHLPQRQWPRRKTDIAQAAQEYADHCRAHLRWAQEITNVPLA